MKDGMERRGERKGEKGKVEKVDEEGKIKGGRTERKRRVEEIRNKNR